MLLLQRAGLNIAAFSSSFILFTGRGVRSRKIALNANRNCIPLEDISNTGVAYVKFLLGATQGPLKATASPLQPLGQLSGPAAPSSFLLSKGYHK